MRYRLLAVVMLLTVGGPARADTDADCVQMVDLVRTINGCSAIIERRPPNSPLTGILNPDFFASPKLGPAHNNRGYAYLLRGEHGRALSDFDAAIRHAPNLAVAHRNRAEVQLHFGRTSQALADAERALALAPNLGIGFATRARVFEKLGRAAEAGRDYRRACEIGEPQDACQHALRLSTDEQSRNQLMQAAKNAEKQRMAHAYANALASCRDGNLSECDSAERFAATDHDRSQVAEVRLLGAARARIQERNRRDPRAAEAAWHERFRKVLEEDERAHLERKRRMQ